VKVWPQGTKVFVNGKWIGVHQRPDELKQALLRLRRRLAIPEDVSIAFDHALSEIRIYNDWGRVCRPLFVVEDAHIKVTPQHIRQLQVRKLDQFRVVCPVLHFSWSLEDVMFGLPVKLPRLSA
jgi:DNA-directed RNA polymerase II subunit RPB2